ncbi:ATP-binding cassette domain-containing protein [Micromonospora eburnea]|nr:ATP-binding cassette domain-containing protein [Micromonospora eburnea]
MPTQITAFAVSGSSDSRLVLDPVTGSLVRGERTGIIGENGFGKATVLRLLAGREPSDRGEVVVRADGGVGHLAQDGRLPPRDRPVAHRPGSERSWSGGGGRRVRRTAAVARPGRGTGPRRLRRHLRHRRPRSPAAPALAGRPPARTAGTGVRRQRLTRPQKHALQEGND